MTTTLALVPAERDALGQVLDGARLAVAAAVAEWKREGGRLDLILGRHLDAYERRLRPGSG